MKWLTLLHEPATKCAQKVCSLQQLIPINNFLCECELIYNWGTACFQISISSCFSFFHVYSESFCISYIFYTNYHFPPPAKIWPFWRSPVSCYVRPSFSKQFKMALIHWELNWIWIASKFICDICKYSESLTPLACNDTFATRPGVETYFYLGSIGICFKVSGEPQNESYIWT